MKYNSVLHVRAITYMNGSAFITSTNCSRRYKYHFTDIAITDNYSKGVNKCAALNYRRGNIRIKISLYIRVDIRPCCNILRSYIEYIRSFICNVLSISILRKTDKCTYDEN